MNKFSSVAGFSRTFVMSRPMVASALFVLVALLLFVSSPVQAGPLPQDPAELEAFIDELVGSQLREYEIAGATVSVVPGGSLLFAKGYGVADVASGRPVVAEETLFHTGSVSKLFTWTALMQLIEQDRVGLHRDVNEYSGDVRIPPAFDESVTPWHLFTHTPGFEDRVIGLFADDVANVGPLEQVLAASVPDRRQPPGESSSYSNYGAALAGHIVANVSGIPFERYIEEHILQPLDMERTSFRQPLSAHLEKSAAKGYVPTQGGFREGPAEYISLAPAGALWSTATDMAKFMIAHLQKGRKGDAEGAGETGGIRILERTTAERMHQRQFAHAPELNGMTYGFMEMSRNGHTFIGHGGDTNLFHTVLMLAPEHDVGVFVSYNSLGGAEAREYFVRAFVDEYFPPAEPHAEGQPVATATDLSRFVGDYLLNRGSLTDVTKVATGALPVRKAEEGGLLIAVSFPEPDMARFEQVGALLFRQVDGDELVAFGQDEHGQITRLFLNSLPMLAFDRVGWHETMTFHGIVFALCLLLFLSALIGWPLGAWRRRRLQSASGAGGIPRLALGPRLASARWAAGSGSGLFVLFCVFVAAALQDPTAIAYGIPQWLAVAFALPLAAIIPTVLSVGHTVRGWRTRSWSGGARVHFTLVTLAAVTFLLQLHYWNLLGFRY